jgi:hypothetical protein
MAAKFSSLIALLFVGVSAQALVLPNGGFVPQQCGAQSIDTAHRDTHVMESACVGFLSGTQTKAVQFTLSDDSTFVFRVQSQNNLMMAMASGATMTIYKLVGVNGEVLTMKAIVNQDGTLKSISGEFQTNSYIVPNLQQMLTLQ